MEQAGEHQAKAGVGEDHTGRDRSADGEAQSVIRSAECGREWGRARRCIEWRRQGGGAVLSGGQDSTP